MFISDTFAAGDRWKFASIYLMEIRVKNEAGYMHAHANSEHLNTF